VANAVYEQESAARQHIVETLAQDVPLDLAEAVADQFVIYCGSGELGAWPAPKRRGDLDVEVGTSFLGPYTIREAELSDLRTILGGLAVAALAPLEIDATVSLTLAAACMLWRLRRRGVSLNPLQCQVLIALRKDGPLAMNELFARVRSRGSTWTDEDVLATIEELKGVRLNDGSTAALVHCASDGRWSTDARGLWEVPFGSIR
jgi:hypothetical protein